VALAVEFEESVTWAVNPYVPVELGVPLSVPVLLRATPAGN
jgi:hypothetical protein